MNEDFEERIEGARIEIELYVCASTAGSGRRKQEVANRIDRLVANGVADAVDRRTWTRKVATSRVGDDDPDVQTKYAEFAAWARAEDRSLSPAFAQETVRNEFLDEEYEVLRVPIVTVAVYADGDLARLAPSIVDGRRYSVDDCLADLEALDERRHSPDSAVQEA